jgi:hypothetical protein
MNRPKPFESVNVKRWAVIIWPAFVTACLLEAFIFSVVDPSELDWSGYMLQLSRQGVYTMEFFCFWLISMVCSGLTLWLVRPDQTIRNPDSF